MLIRPEDYPTLYGIVRDLSRLVPRIILWPWLPAAPKSPPTVTLIEEDGPMLVFALRIKEKEEDTDDDVVDVCVHMSIDGGPETEELWPWPVPELPPEGTPLTKENTPEGTPLVRVPQGSKVVVRYGFQDDAEPANESSLSEPIEFTANDTLVPKGPEGVAVLELIDEEADEVPDPEA